jgi:hypothetical protein
LNISFYGEADGKQYHHYKNVPTSLGALISANRATLHELQTVYDIEDVYDMLEIVVIDSANAHIARRD